MVFQPVSPIRDFQRRLSRNTREDPAASSKQFEDMCRKNAKVSKKLQKKLEHSESISEAQLQDVPSSATSSSGILIQAEPFQRTTQTQSTPLTPKRQTRFALEQDDQLQTYHGTAGATSSDMIDFAQAISLPEATQRKSIGTSQSPKSPRTPSRPISTAAQSFFEADSDSDDNEPIFGRADSVPAIRPSIIQHSPSKRAHSGRTSELGMNTNNRPVSPLTAHIGEISQATADGSGVTKATASSEGPTQALQKLEGTGVNDAVTAATDVASTDMAGQQANRIEASASDKEASRGYRVAGDENCSTDASQPTSSAPAKRLSQRRVMIKPSNLIVHHPKEGTRNFRETVVTTPYPALEEEKDSSDTSEKEDKRDDRMKPQRTNTVKSTRFENDRFPSIDQGEVLFLDLGIAQHPGMTTTLEIHIADKSTYDDEMLFHQIRKVYRSRLLGLHRRPFCLIRAVTHATVSPSVQYDFKVAEFMKHFRYPHIGRKRKTWIIWLRCHSQNQQHIRGEGLSMATKCPLSASLRSADKRLSMQSDSTSTLNFPFLPALSLMRLPFCSKEASAPSSASTYRETYRIGSDHGSGSVKIELHHEFSFWVLAFMFFWVIFFSVAAVVLWIIFGVPGTRPGEERKTMDWSTSPDRFSWSIAAQTRVLTGLVLGLAVALLGSMVELCLIAGAYVLL